MTNIQLYKEIESLPDDLKKELKEFVQHLKEKAKLSSDSKRIKVRRPGSLKGKIKMSADFDEPLEDFKEYM